MLKSENKVRKQITASSGFSCSGRQSSITVFINMLGPAVSKQQETVRV